MQNGCFIINKTSYSLFGIYHTLQNLNIFSFFNKFFLQRKYRLQVVPQSNSNYHSLCTNFSVTLPLRLYGLKLPSANTISQSSWLFSYNSDKKISHAVNENPYSSYSTSLLQYVDGEINYSVRYFHFVLTLRKAQKDLSNGTQLSICGFSYLFDFPFFLCKNIKKFFHLSDSSYFFILRICSILLYIFLKILCTCNNNYVQNKNMCFHLKHLNIMHLFLKQLYKEYY